MVLAVLLMTACSSSNQNHQDMEGKNHDKMSSMDHDSSDSDHSLPGMDHQGHNETKPSSDIKTNWSFAETTPQSNKDEKLTISIEKNDGTPVEEFEINHEKKMHLIIVSKDLSFFNHIHPEYEGKGIFTITTQFPAGGEYKMFADYIPKGETGVIGETWVTVAGSQSQPQELDTDRVLSKVMDGKEVTLTFDGDLKAGKELMMTYHIKDAATKEPITNLQPYLGAIGHVVILSSDAEEYLHVHPSDENTTGPDAKFQTEFPNPGVYKIWGEFQHEGKVLTVPFVVNVQ
jgi:hypothetical protein